MGIFKLLFKLLLFVLPIALIAMPLYLVWSALQPLPLVEADGTIKQEQVGRARTLFKQHDPRNLKDGEVRSVTVLGRDLQVMLASVLPLVGNQRVAVDLDSGSADLFYTAVLPANPLGKYFNLSTHLVQAEERVRMETLRFGDVALPGWLLYPPLRLANFILTNRFEEYRGAMAALQLVELQNDAVHVVYQWNAQLAQQLEQRGRDLLLPATDRERIIAYYGEISRQSRRFDHANSLSTLLQPLFVLAAARSEQGGDPAAENRALFMALGVAMREDSLGPLVGRDPAELPPAPAKLRYTLVQRTDLANRFALAAAITSAGGGGLAEAVGQFKEMDDSRGRSGFSFPDLLADRAGVVFAEAALGSRAAEIQRALSAGPQEREFMPSIANLPEGLGEMAFQGRFQDLESAGFIAVKMEIENRIAACALYR